MPVNKYIILILWCICLFFIKIETIFASNSSDSIYYGLEIKYHLGFVVPHHPDMIYYLKDYTKSGEINFIRRRYKSENWESDFKRLETGIGLWYSSLGNQKIYGQCLAIYPFLNLNLFKAGNFDVKTRVALGIGYSNNPYNSNSNPFNAVMGSHFNAYIGFGLMMYYPIVKNLYLQGGMSLNHLSNGAVSKPNHGMNNLALTFGAKYDLTEPNDFINKHKMPKTKNRELITTFSVARNQPALFYYKKFWSGSLTATHLWYVNDKTALGLGADFIRYGGAPFANKGLSEFDENFSYNFSDYFYMGIITKMEFFLGNTSLYMAPGVYLHYKTELRQPVYARLGVKQKIYGNIYAHFGIKADFFTAEFIEFGLGYRCKLK